MKIKLDTRTYKGKDHEFMGWRVWTKPKPTHTYAIGVDTSEGKGQDASSIQVIDATDGVQVANFWSNHIDEDNFAAEVYKAGYYYNKARAIVECNNQSGGAVITNLSGAYSHSLRYPYLYKRYDYDEYTKTKTKKVGWRTTGTNKGIIISNLNAALRDGELRLVDQYTIKELTSFLRDEKTGKLGAKGKGKDDRVMALALAWEQVLISRLSTRHTNPQQQNLSRLYDPETGFPY